jgi:hypothetical protein
MFLATRCDRRFLQAWISRDPRRLDTLGEPGLMLEADDSNELVARLNQYGLLPEELRSTFASKLIAYCLTGEDPSVLWNQKLASILCEDERLRLHTRVRLELLADLPAAIRSCTNDWDHRSSQGPEDAVEPLRSLVYQLPRVFPDDATIDSTARALDRLLDEWVANQGWEKPHRSVTHDKILADLPTTGSTFTPKRSLFDDLLDGR